MSTATGNIATGTVAPTHSGDRPVARPERRTFTETKLGAKTSEFYLTIIAIAGILFATYIESDDSLVLDDGWRMASFVAIAYIISRGLAKLGTREPYTEDNEY